MSSSGRLMLLKSAVFQLLKGIQPWKPGKDAPGSQSHDVVPAGIRSRLRAEPWQQRLAAAGCWVSGFGCTVGALPITNSHSHLTFLI